MTIRLVVAFLAVALTGDTVTVDGGFFWSICEFFCSGLRRSMAVMPPKMPPYGYVSEKTSVEMKEISPFQEVSTYEPKKVENAKRTPIDGIEVIVRRVTPDGKITLLESTTLFNEDGSFDVQAKSEDLDEHSGYQVNIDTAFCGGTEQCPLRVQLQMNGSVLETKAKVDLQNPDPLPKGVVNIQYNSCNLPTTKSVRQALPAIDGQRPGLKALVPNDNPTDDSSQP